jgi:hypothetical protein
MNEDCAAIVSSGGVGTRRVGAISFVDLCSLHETRPCLGCARFRQG